MGNSEIDPFKSPGGNGTIPVLLQKGPDPLYALLCNLFQASIAFSYIPQAWRATRVVFIPKHGRNNYTEAKAYTYTYQACIVSSKGLEKAARKIYSTKGIIRHSPTLKSTCLHLSLALRHCIALLVKWKT